MLLSTLTANKSILRAILVSLLLISGLYLFTVSFEDKDIFTSKMKSSRLSKDLSATNVNEQFQSFSEEYYYFQTTHYQHTNPSQLSFPHDRFKAAFYTFIKNDSFQLTRLRSTLRNIEDMFNKHHHYPYIIYSDQDLDDQFRELASSLVAPATMIFNKIDKSLYGYRNDTNLEKAAEARVKLNTTMFGDSEDYRFQSRFMAGTIYRDKFMQELDYAWRFEAGTEYLCPFEYDPFKYMLENNKKTSFVMALYEYRETIPSLYQTVLHFAQEHLNWIQPASNPNTLWHFILDNNNGFNGCHLWNNFQIADVRFYRGEKYQEFFEYLDKSNGIFYERWGDPVMQSLGALLFLNKDDIHFWDDVGYRVANYFTHCPTDKSKYGKCSCRPQENFDDNNYSCLRFY